MDSSELQLPLGLRKFASPKELELPLELRLELRLGVNHARVLVELQDLVPALESDYDNLMTKDHTPEKANPGLQRSWMTWHSVSQCTVSTKMASCTQLQ